MADPNPHRAPEEWSTVVLAGWKVPLLLVAVNGVTIEDEWQVQRAIGTSGSTTVWRGTKPNEELELEFDAPNEDTFDSIRPLWDRLKPVSGRRPPTVTIVHPAPNFIGVNRVSRKKWTGPFQKPQLNWGVKLLFIQYFPLVIIPAGPQEPAKLPGAPTPLDAGEKVIAELAKKLEAL